MDSLLTEPKRKKRKSRKCLDELRKRSRNSIKTDSSKRLAGEGDNQKNCNMRSNYITDSRLTLKMLPKAVRSDIITRHKIQPVRIHHLSNNESLSKSDQIISEARTTNIQNSSICDVLSSSDENRNDFEPPPLKTCISIVSPECLAATPTAAGESYGYCMYEEIMKEISSCFQNNFTTLSRDDVSNRSITSLRNIYNMRFQDEPKVNTHGNVDSNDSLFTVNMELDENSAVSTDSTVQNPMDYLRLGWLKESQSDESESNSSSFDAIIHSAKNTESSLYESSSHNTPSILPPTPNYTFYPHKLNE